MGSQKETFVAKTGEYQADEYLLRPKPLFQREEGLNPQTGLSGKSNGLSRLEKDLKRLTGKENVNKRLEMLRKLKDIHNQYNIPKQPTQIEADLHNHTYHSDGVQSPSELVYEAFKKGLKAIAVTDHNTLEGVNEAIQAGKILEIEVIPGVEIMTSDYDRFGTEILILFPDVERFQKWFNSSESEKMRRILENAVSAHQELYLKVVEWINKTYPDLSITEDDILKVAKERPFLPGCLSDVIWKKYGQDRFSQITGIQIQNAQDIYDKFIAPGLSRYKLRFIKPEEAIRLAKENGAISILAHPKQYLVKTNSNQEGLISYVRRLTKRGLSGIQVDDFRNRREDTEFFVRVADRFGLIMISGSDSHGVSDTKLGRGRVTDEFPNGNLEPRFGKYHKLAEIKKVASYKDQDKRPMKYVREVVSDYVTLIRNMIQGWLSQRNVTTDISRSI